MAKRDDDDFDADEVVEAAEDADDVAADADESIADADEAEDAEPAYADEEPYEEEAPRRTPRVTALTLVLCFLNVLAALGFVFLLMLNFEKRQRHTYAGVQHEFLLVGIGTQEDTKGATAAVEAAPRPKFSSEELKNAFRQRGGASVSEPFSAVEDGIRYQLYAGEFGKDQVREMMGDLGDPVDSIEAEMTRLKTSIPEELNKAAEQLKASLQKASDAEKQKRLSMLLYPLCVNPKQVNDLQDRIYGNPAKKISTPAGAVLDTMLEDALKRRILADILLPIEMFRASDPIQSIAKATETKSDGKALFPDGVVSYGSVMEHAAELDAAKLLDLLTRRLDAAASENHDGSVHFGKEWDGKRWTIEKRANAAFVLVSLAYARKHIDSKAKLEDQLLYPRGLERAQRLSGLYDFTAACRSYDAALRKLEARVIDAIALDRDGFHMQVGQEVRRSQGFADKHAALQVQIRALQLQIRQAEGRLDDLKKQIDQTTKLVAEREKHKTEVQARIFQERAATAKRIAELRALQEQLHRALVELADAAETNARLEQRLRQLSGAKGGEQ